ncbi:plasmid mobilization relaxosome protein MobC [Arthrobacter sp. ERGS1:01]|uniref:plasmid mobilization relaxosome protein MobC n=1 Tax=Arthrobacter sp. ERGS1:01 TaxID=1704044 RepID=UPI0009E805EE|nr:plasmid mobilization relaxosome protein MobC [Arthrobacter sp. ERGS1:01]
MPARIRSENVSGGRNAQPFQVKVSEHERAALLLRADRAKKSVPRLLRESALTDGGAERLAVEVEVKEELAGIRNLVRSLSNNINQLARHANSTGEFPAEAATAVAAVQRAALRVNMILAKMEQS